MALHMPYVHEDSTTQDQHPETDSLTFGTVNTIKAAVQAEARAAISAQLVQLLETASFADAFSAFVIHQNDTKVTTRIKASSPYQQA